MTEALIKEHSAQPLCPTRSNIPAKQSCCQNASCYIIMYVTTDLQAAGIVQSFQADLVSSHTSQINQLESCLFEEFVLDLL